MLLSCGVSWKENLVALLPTLADWRLQWWVLDANATWCGSGHYPEPNYKQRPPKRTRRIPDPARGDRRDHRFLLSTSLPYLHSVGGRCHGQRGARSAGMTDEMPPLLPSALSQVRPSTREIREGSQPLWECPQGTRRCSRRWLTCVGLSAGLTQPLLSWSFGRAGGPACSTVYPIAPLERCHGGRRWLAAWGSHPHAALACSGDFSWRAGAPTSKFRVSFKSRVGGGLGGDDPACPSSNGPMACPARSRRRHRSNGGRSGPFQLWWKCSNAISLDRLMRLKLIGAANRFPARRSRG